MTELYTDDLMSYDKVFHWTTIAPIEIKPGFFRRTLINGEKLTVILSEVKPGASGSPHSHPEEQVMFMLKGTCRDQEGTLYEPGTVTYIASNKKHGGLVTISSESSIILELFAPPRQKDPLTAKNDDRQN